jgi:hypothetical protein
MALSHFNVVPPWPLDNGEAGVAAVSTPVAEKCGVSSMAAAVNNVLLKQTDRVEVKNNLSQFSRSPSPRDLDELRSGAESGQQHWHHWHHK